MNDDTIRMLNEYERERCLRQRVGSGWNSRMEKEVNRHMTTSCATCDERASRRATAKAWTLRLAGGLLYASFHVGATVAIVVTLA